MIGHPSLPDDETFERVKLAILARIRDEQANPGGNPVITTITCPACQEYIDSITNLPDYLTATTRRCPFCKALLILNWSSGAMTARLSALNARSTGKVGISLARKGAR